MRVSKKEEIAASNLSIKLVIFKVSRLLGFTSKGSSMVTNASMFFICFQEREKKEGREKRREEKRREEKRREEKRREEKEAQN